MQGTQIEITFWREQAIEKHATLKEGTVYYFSNGAVLPSNRKYSTVDNDYKINMGPKSSVEQAADQACTPAA